MIQCTQIVTKRGPLDSGIRGTETTALIQCINGQEPQINKLWCLCFDGIFSEVDPIARVDILDGIVGEFVADYFSENGHRIAIIGQISVNGSVHFLLLSEQAWVIVFTYIANLVDQVEATGWGSSNNSNKIRGGRFNDANRIANAAWGASTNFSPTNLPRGPVHPRAARVCIRNFFLCRRRQERLWRQFNYLNYRVFWLRQDRDGPVTQ